MLKSHGKKIVGLALLIILSLFIPMPSVSTDSSVIVFQQRIIVEPGNSKTFTFIAMSNFSVLGTKVDIYSNYGSSARFSLFLINLDTKETIWKETDNPNIRGGFGLTGRRNITAGDYGFLVNNVLVSKVDLFVVIAFGFSHHEVLNIMDNIVEPIVLDYLDPVPFLLMILLVILYTLGIRYIFRMNRTVLIIQKRPGEKFMRYPATILYWITFGLSMACFVILSGQLAVVSYRLSLIFLFSIYMFLSFPATISAFYSGYWSGKRENSALLATSVIAISSFFVLWVGVAYIFSRDPYYAQVIAFVSLVGTLMFIGFPTIALSWILVGLFSLLGVKIRKNQLQRTVSTTASSCPRCGHQVVPGGKFCTYCGTILSNHQNKPPK
ncbi:MAG: zinc ribbon domain-containing protein [Candidatus Hodarchaeota archaeon]